MFLDKITQPIKFQYLKFGFNMTWACDTRKYWSKKKTNRFLQFFFSPRPFIQVYGFVVIRLWLFPKSLVRFNVINTSRWPSNLRVNSLNWQNLALQVNCDPMKFVKPLFSNTYQYKKGVDVLHFNLCKHFEGERGADVTVPGTSLYSTPSR